MALVSVLKNCLTMQLTTHRILDEEEDLHKNEMEEEDTDKREPAALKPTMNSPCETHEELIVHVNGQHCLRRILDEDLNKNVTEDNNKLVPASMNPAELPLTVQEK